MDDLTERLRSVKWEVTDDCDRMPDDPTHKCVFVDMRPADFSALLTEAAAALEAAQQRIACLPADWREDSSLETWFPFTAEQLAATHQRIAELERALEAAREDGARLRKTLRDVTGVAICGLFDTHREDTLREFSLQELARVTEVTAPLLEEGVTVESVYRRGYDVAIDAAMAKENE